MKLKFKITFLGSLERGDIVIRGDEVDTDRLTVEEVTGKVIEVEQFLEKLTGRRVHIDQVL